MALLGSYRLVWIAYRAHRENESLARQSLFSWESGYWAYGCLLVLSLVIAAVQPLRLVGVWLVGVALLGMAVLGLSARYTWYRFTRATPETHPFRYWAPIAVGAVVGPVVIAGATYRVGAPIGAMCAPWTC